MARPLKQTVDYFPHFVNAGKTLLILQNEFGNNGFAFWFKLLSLLCKTDGQVYDYNNPASWRLLLAETCVSEDIADKVLQLLADIEAIDPELYLAKVIWVQHLVDNLSDVYTRRRNGSVPSRPVIDNINPVIANRKPQTKLNQTKPEKSKYGEFNNVLLSDNELTKLQEKFGAMKAHQLIENLSEGIASKGYKYKDHYATILSWARRDEQKGGQSGVNLGHFEEAKGNKPYTRPPAFRP